MEYLEFVTYVFRLPTAWATSARMRGNICPQCGHLAKWHENKLRFIFAAKKTIRLRTQKQRKSVNISDLYDISVILS